MMSQGSKNLLIAGAIGLIVLVVYLNRPTPSSSGPVQSGPQQGATGASNALSNNVDLDSATAGRDSSAPAKGFDPKNLRSYRVSEEAKREFFEAAFAEAKLPEDLAFIPIDLDIEDTAGIYGRNDLYELSILAGRMTPSDREIVEYLNSGKTGIPQVDHHGLRLSEKVTTAPPIKGNGMQAARYWFGRTNDGKQIRVGMMPREDGVGSYLVLISGEAKVIDDSDDLIDEVYESFKALPTK
ncbi:MAG: hypothetical protein KF789_11255 [Bdellovibrionaceae bacterium]|nr:hypothetical protein [Pseudobdellovibrionaceae bacterium]